MLTPSKIAARLTAWESYLNGGPDTATDAGYGWDLDVIAHCAFSTGDTGLIAHANRVLELCSVVMLRDNNRLHDVLMVDPDLYPFKGEAGYVPSVSLAELDAALAG